MNKCQYCDSELGNKYSLIKHQKKSKYCLIKQGKLEKKKQ